MAYNENEITRLQELKDMGYTKEQAVANVLGQRYKLGNSINMEQNAKQADDEEESRQGSLMWNILKDMPGDLYEAGEGIVGAFKKAGETYKKNTEMIKTGQLDNETSIALADIGTLGSLVGGVVDEVVVGAGKLLTTDQFEKKITQKIGELGKDVMDTDAIKRMTTMYDQLDPNAKAALNGVLGIAHGVTSVTGAGEVVGVVKGGAKKAVELAGEIVETAGKKGVIGRTIDKTFGLGKKAEQVANDVVDVTAVEKRMAQKQLISEGKEVTDDAINQVVNSQKTAPVKVEMFDRLAKLDTKTLQAIKADPDLAEEFLVATLKANENKDARGILAYGGDIMRGYSNDVRAMLNDTGSQIGAWRKANANKIFKVDEVDQAFNDRLANLKLAVNEIDDGRGKITSVIKPIEGKIPEVRAADIKALNEMYKSFQILKQNPTLENIYSFRNNVDRIANFSKTEVSEPLQKFAREIRHDVAEISAKQLPEDQAQLMRDYSSLSGALNDIDELVGRKAGAEYMLRALASGRESVADDALAAIKKYTGHDVKNDALIIKYLMNNVASESQLTSMEQVISSGVLRNVRDVSTPTGLIDKLLDAGVSKFANPERRFKKAIEGARGTKINPLESPKGKAPDLNVGGGKQVDEAVNLVQSKTPEEIRDKLQKIFGSDDELDAIEALGKNVSKEQRQKLGLADRFMADIERAALDRDTSEVETLLNQVRKQQQKQGVIANEAFGVVGGVETDENGKLKFDPIRAMLGVGAISAAKKVGIIKSGDFTVHMPEKGVQKLFRGTYDGETLDSFSLKRAEEYSRTIKGMMAEGPGMYLTNAPEDAARYGSSMIETSLDLNKANIVNTASKPLSTSKIKDILKNIDQETFDDAASNWSENMTKARAALTDEIVNQKNAGDQLMSIWADVFNHQGAQEFADLMKQSGIDGIAVTRDSGIVHHIMYNTDLLERGAKSVDDIQSAVKQKIKLATEVKKELDDHAVKIANNYRGATLVEGPIKTPERIIQKINSDPSYQLDDVKDIVRNTIMAERNHSNIYDELKNLKGFVREKIQTADKFHGYEGAIFNVKLSNGTVGEIQVVTPKMIYGKMEPEVSRELLGDEVFNRIKKETGIEPGMGHKLYEQIQKAHFERGVDSPEAQDLIKQSVDYYKKLK